MAKNKKSQPQFKVKGKQEVKPQAIKANNAVQNKNNKVGNKGKPQANIKKAEAEKNPVVFDDMSDDNDESDLSFVEGEEEESDRDYEIDEEDESEGDSDSEGEEDDGEEEEDEEEAQGQGVENIEGEAIEEEDDEEQEPELIALEDLQVNSDDEDSEPLIDEDAIPVQKISVNDKEGLERVLKKIKNPKLAWIETQVIEEKNAIEIKDVYDDLQRELAFFQQGLSSVLDAKKRFKHLGVPFERPDDYFAEMVKSDAHMMRIRQKILDQTQGIKASETARKQRELKKFGKQIQVEKLKERHLHKKQELEKIKSFKRKLKDNDTDADDFDIELDNEPEPKKKLGKGSNMSRDNRDKKYGFGGKKRFAKSNDKKSTHAEVDGFNLKKNKTPFNSKGGKASGPKKRPGKASRQAGRK